MIKLGVGVIGADPRGFGERAHIPAVISSSRLRLVAVCTAHDETAQSAARRHGLSRWYSDAGEMALDSEVDLVVIAVRPRFHLELAEAAVRAGKPVYCEWPLARTTEEAVRMAQLVQQAGVANAVGLQGRFAPPLAEMRRTIEQGRIGTPLSFEISLLQEPFQVHSDRLWLTRSDEASGALHVATAHIMDALQDVLGSVTRVSAITRTLITESVLADAQGSFAWETPDTVLCLAEVGDGIPGTVEVSNVTRPPLGFTFRVLGDDGQVVARAPRYFQFSPIELSVGRPTGEFEVLAVTGDERDDNDPATNVGRALDEFAAAIATSAGFSPDFQDGVDLHRLVDAIARSSAADSDWQNLPW